MEAKISQGESLFNAGVNYGLSMVVIRLYEFLEVASRSSETKEAILNGLGYEITCLKKKIKE
jgi:hypothetical protein